MKIKLCIILMFLVLYFPIVHASVKDIVLEAEDYVQESGSIEIVKNVNANGGKAVLFAEYLKSPPPILTTMDFQVEQPGEYEMTVYAATSITFPYPGVLSPLTVSVNGEPSILLEGSNVEAIDPDKEYLHDPYFVKYIRVRKMVNLKAGDNTVVLTFSQRGNENGGIHGAIDAVKFTIPKHIEGLQIKGSSRHITPGNPIDFSLMNSDGDTVSLSSLNSVSFQTSNPLCGDVTNTGQFTPFNYGAVKVTAKGSRGAQTFSAQQTFYITSNKGLYLSGSGRNGKTITANVGAAADYAGGDSLLMVAYGVADDGKLTSIKDVKTVPVMAMAENEEQSIAESFTHLSEGDVVYLYLIDETDNTNAIYGKVEIGQEE